MSERLDNVVVGADIEAADTICGRIIRTQDNDRDVRAAETEVAHEVETTLVRRTEVENQDIDISDGRAQFVCWRPSVGDVNGMSGAAQLATQRGPAMWIVINQEDAHDP